MVLVALIGLAGPGPVAAEDSTQGAEGRLDQALEALRAEGLPLVFTSELVGPELRVYHPATGNDPRQRLEALLAPHGLTVREAAGDRLIVVRAPRPTARLSGRVLGPEGQGIAAAVVWIERRQRRAITDQLGRFVFDDLVGGELKLECRARTFHPGHHRLVLLAGESRQLDLRLDPLPADSETVEVTASWPWLVGEELSVVTLDRRDLVVLPHFGDDVLRGLESLPGNASSDGSAKIHVRGGDPRELMVLLDGFELVEPFHLKDYNDALAVFRPETLERVELLSGGFGAEFGDRMTGVLDLTTRTPRAPRRTDLLISPVSLDLGLSGRGAPSPAADRPGTGWLVHARGGSLEPAFELLGEEENPGFWDLFGKLEGGRDDRSWRAQTLGAGDQLDFTVRDDDTTEERFRTEYRNLNGWFSHRRALGPRTVLDHRLGVSHLDRDRLGLENQDDREFDLRDLRELEVLSLAHDGSRQLGSRGLLRWGVEARALDASYDYRSQLGGDGALGNLRPPDTRQGLRFAEEFDGEQFAAYLSQRQRFDRLTVEAGLRFDRNTILGDERFDPRLSVGWQVAERTRWRASWGRYSQSQRLYELQVEDGETAFSPSERARSWTLGVDHTFEVERGCLRGPLELRVELYGREVDNPRRRWENLFDPLGPAPEVADDRVQLDPERTLARGLEMLLGGRGPWGLEWFASYTRASVEDRIEGHWVPRAVDQPHAVGLDLLWKDLGRWDVALVGSWHTGWPTTAISGRLETVDGETRVVPALGPLRGERLPDYHRLDLRVARRFTLRGKLEGVDLEAALEIRNLANRTNLRGFDVGFEILDDDTVVTTKTPETWGGRLPFFTLHARF